jgi:hypothetical protein
MTMSQLRAKHENHMEPEFARRLFNWIEAQGGAIGIGGGYRPPGTQPDKPGFAPPGMSFHEGQTFADGTVWFSAVDLVHVNPGKVHRAPTVAECPQQGSAESRLWGLHINTSESWHMQAVPQDGYLSWVDAGRPRPKPNYPIPGGVTPPSPPEEEDDMPKALLIADGQSMYAWNGVSLSGVTSPELAQAGYAAGLFVNDPATVVDYPKSVIDQLKAVE